LRFEGFFLRSELFCAGFCFLPTSDLTDAGGKNEALAGSGLILLASFFEQGSEQKGESNEKQNLDAGRCCRYADDKSIS